MQRRDAQNEIMETGVSVLYLEPCALPEETLIVSCCHCRGNTAMNGAGLGIDRPAELSKNDDEYDAYRKRMMLAYRFRPNPLVTTVALLQCWHFKLFLLFPLPHLSLTVSPVVSTE